MCAAHVGYDLSEDAGATADWGLGAVALFLQSPPAGATRYRGWPMPPLDKRRKRNVLQGALIEVRPSPERQGPRAERPRAEGLGPAAAPPAPSLPRASPSCARVDLDDFDTVSFLKVHRPQTHYLRTRARTHSRHSPTD